MNNFDPRFWIWGYVLDTVPGEAFFVDGTTRSSLETVADYLKCDNAYWMNSLHTLDSINPRQCERMQNVKNVFCGLTHIEANGPGKGGWQIKYVESAEKIARLSLQYPNIKGAIIDDFRSPTGPSKNMTDEELHQVYCTLKNINPELKLYLVHYHITQNPAMLESCRNDFDGLSIWSWHSNDYFWQVLYDDEIRHIREQFPDKDLNQGMFIHAYGDGGIPQPMDQLKLQCRKFADKLDSNAIDSWCLIQSGFFCREDHREQVEFIKNYWDYYRGTRTILPTE